MTNTKNYKLNKPDTSDQYNIDHFNQNADTIDKALNDIVKGNTPIEKVKDDATMTPSGNELATVEGTVEKTSVVLKEKGWYRICKIKGLIKLELSHIWENDSSQTLSVIASMSTSSSSKGAIKSITQLSFPSSIVEYDKIRFATNNEATYIDLYKRNSSKNRHFISIQHPETIKYLLSVALVPDTAEGETYTEYPLIPDCMAYNGAPVATTDGTVEKKTLSFTQDLGFSTNETVTVDALFAKLKDKISSGTIVLEFTPIGGKINLTDGTNTFNMERGSLYLTINFSALYMVGIYTQPVTNKAILIRKNKILQNVTELATTDGTVENANNAKKVSQDSSMELYAENTNEINFGGTETESVKKGIVIFGASKKGNRTIPNSYRFGLGDGTAEVRAKNFLQDGKQVATIEDISTEFKRRMSFNKDTGELTIDLN